MTTTETPPDSSEDAPESVEADPDSTEEDEKTVLQHLGTFGRELFVVVVGAMIVSTLLRMFVGQMFMIPSASMENTLLIGDRVVVQKVTHFHRGDVVVFSDPGGWLRNANTVPRGTLGRAGEFIGVLPDTSTGHIIKRVIGLPGDKVICCDTQGRITVNGQALDETSYLYKDASGKQVDPSDVRFQVIVPKGRVFVMGDHRNESADSRCHLSDVYPSEPKGAVAFVPEKLVEGPALAVVAPFNRAQRLQRPATFATVPVAAQPAPDAAVIKPANVTC